MGLRRQEDNVLPPKLVLFKVYKMKRNAGVSFETWWIQSRGGMTGQVEVDLAIKKASSTRFETLDQDLPIGLIILCNRSNSFIVTDFYEKEKKF